MGDLVNKILVDVSAIEVSQSSADLVRYAALSSLIYTYEEKVKECNEEKGKNRADDVPHRPWRNQSAQSSYSLHIKG